MADEDNPTSPTGKITVSNPVEGETYTIYKLLDLKYDDTNKSYSYTVNNAWTDFFKEGTGALDYVTITNGYVSWNASKTNADGNPVDVDKFAALAKSFASTSNVVNVTSQKAEKDKAVEFTNLDLGYYLMDSTLGALCSLDTTNFNVSIKEKNEKPTVDKQVKEDSSGIFGSINDADLTQIVEYKSKIVIHKGSENVVFHDKMDAGLTLLNENISGEGDYRIKVYTDEKMEADSELSATQTSGSETTTNFTVTTSSSSSPLSDGCSFEIAFDESYLNGISDDTGVTLYVNYFARLNGNAVISTGSNDNEVYLKYGNTNETHETPHHETRTYAWEFSVHKYTGKTPEEDTALAGAKFTLHKEDVKAGNTTTYYATFDNNNKVNGWVTDSTAAGVLTSGADGNVSFKGLDADTYYLTETEAPQGYNKLAAPIKVTITSTEQVDEHAVGKKWTSSVSYVEGTKNGETIAYTGTAQNAENGVIKVKNESGTELPSTGGMGTTILYVGGGILVAAAAILLIVKKRMSVEK